MDPEALKERNTWLITYDMYLRLTRGDALRSAQRLPLANVFRAFGAKHS